MYVALFRYFVLLSESVYASDAPERGFPAVEVTDSDRRTNAKYCQRNYFTTGKRLICRGFAGSLTSNW